MSAQHPLSITRKTFLQGLGCAWIASLAACKQEPAAPADTPAPAPESTVDLGEFSALTLKSDAWNYDKTIDCYYQLSVPYCLHPVNKSFNALSIYVPAAYFNGKKQGSTWSCEINTSASVGAYTPQSAPIVMPLNSAYFTPQTAPNTFEPEGLARYLKAGMVYVYAGFRGRSSGFESEKKDMFPGGAPWSLVDLKSAIRFLRYNASVLPAHTDFIFPFGYGAAATLCSVLGTAGDEEFFAPYLKKTGAATHDANGKNLSDAICGAALWCPLLDSVLGDCAYEWMMGQFVDDESRKPETYKKLLSKDMANAYAEAMNALGLCDDKGEKLALSQIDDGSYVDGSYYNLIMQTLAEAATYFVKHTQFPYIQTPSHIVEPSFPGFCASHVHQKQQDKGTSAQKAPQPSPNDAGAPAKNTASSAPSKNAASQAQPQVQAQPQAAVPAPGAADELMTTGVSKVQTVSYESVSSYLAALNNDNRWISYSSSRGRVVISNLWEFITHCKRPSKAVSAFDALDKSTPSNQFFGIDNESTLHFDHMVADILTKKQDAYQKADKNFDPKLVESYTQDTAKKDALGTEMPSRVAALDPLHRICGAYQDSFGKATVAPYWRVNTGLMNHASPLTTELNLVYALKNYKGVKDVQFTPVWDRGFELCEREGHPQDNFISWVHDCVVHLVEDEHAALAEGRTSADADDANASDASDN